MLPILFNSSLLSFSHRVNFCFFNFFFVFLVHAPGVHSVFLIGVVLSTVTSSHVVEEEEKHVSRRTGGS